MKGQNRARGPAPVSVHAVLTLLVLVVAYFTWTRDRSQVQSEWVVALDIGKRDIQSLVYEDEARKVTLEKRSTPTGDPYTWLTVRSTQKNLVTNPLAPPQHGMPPGPHGAPPAPPPPAAPGVKPAPPAAPGMPGAKPAPAAPGARPAAPPAAPPTAPGARPAAAPQKGGEKGAADKDKPIAAPPVPAAPAAPPPPHAVPPATAAATPPPPPAPAPIHEVKETVVTREFRGNEQADKLFELFTPMRVVRALGMVDDKKAKELGLDVSKKSLTVVAKGQSVKYVIGFNSYGTGDVYARDAQGQVYLFAHRTVNDFEFAESRMMERRLHRFERPDFDRIEVQSTTAKGQKTRTLLQKNRLDNANFFFTDSTAPDKRDDTLRNWVDKIQRMAIQDYVAQGEEPQPIAPASGQPNFGDVVTVRYFDGSKEIGKAVFSRYPNKSGQNEYFGRTETTIGLVRLLTPTSESAIQDAENW